MLAYLDAEIVSGIDTILALIGFDKVIKDANYVITGEGKLDTQSFNGKLIDGVLKYTTKVGVPTICICGAVRNESIPRERFYAIYETSPVVTDSEYIKKNAHKFYEQTAKPVLLDILR